MAAKRPEGQIIRLPSGKWKARITRVDETGRRRSPSKACKTKREAQRWIREQKTAVDRGTYTEPSRETLGVYLRDWLKTTRTGRAPRTQRDYTRVLTRYVLPRLGGLKLADLRAQHIQVLYAELQERGLSRRTGARGLGPRSIRLIHAPLRQALSQAVAWGKIAKSPTDGVKLPKQRRRERRALSASEVRALLDAAKGTPFEALWRFLVDSGARPGEALGLRWTDVDLDAGNVTIRGAIAQDERGRAVLSEHPKTARSRRTVHLHPQTIEALRVHRTRQAAHALKVGAAFDRTAGLVFCNEAGGILHESNLRRRHWRPLIEVAGLPRDLTPYTLRHTCATLALQAGVPVLVVAERLGHSNANMVLSVYGHVLEGQQAEATARLGTVLFGDDG